MASPRICPGCGKRCAKYVCKACGYEAECGIPTLDGVLTSGTGIWHDVNLHLYAVSVAEYVEQRAARRKSKEERRGK